MPLMPAARLLAPLALAGAALLLPQPADAAPIDRQHWSDSFDALTSPCGFDAQVHGEATGSYVLVSHGDRLAYWHEDVRVLRTFTGVESGRTMRQVLDFHTQDQKVVDNGDGTLTITEKSVGPMRVYGSDGHLMFVDTSALWWTITLDDGGTPANPEDDVVLDESDPFKDVGNQGADGRDFCADLTAQIG